MWLDRNPAEAGMPGFDIVVFAAMALIVSEGKPVGPHLSGTHTVIGDRSGCENQRSMF